MADGEKLVTLQTPHVVSYNQQGAAVPYSMGEKSFGIFKVVTAQQERSTSVNDDWSSVKLDQ